MLGGESHAFAMSLLPRWRFMSEQSRALVVRTAISAVVVLMAALVLRALLPWVVLLLFGWLAWQVFRRR